jgi:hypothetical protein
MAAFAEPHCISNHSAAVPYEFKDDILETSNRQSIGPNFHDDEFSRLEVLDVRTKAAYDALLCQRPAIEGGRRRHVLIKIRNSCKTSASSRESSKKRGARHIDVGTCKELPKKGNLNTINT